MVPESKRGWVVAATPRMSFLEFTDRGEPR
jgi:hypothetical protein